MLTAEIASTSRKRIPRGMYLRIGAHQPVARRAHRLDRRTAVGLGQFATEVADIDVQHVGSGVVVVAPDRIQDLRPGEDLIGVTHQIRKELEFSSGQSDRTSGTADVPGAEVEHDVPDLERGRARLPGLTKLRSDPGQEL